MTQNILRQTNPQQTNPRRDTTGLIGKRVAGARRRRRLGRIGLLALGLSVVMGMTGLLYGMWADGAARRNLPPPGELVDVGGYRLHLHTLGERRPGVPVVILEHGGSSLSAQWGWIQPALAQHTQVVAYARPGMGWSDPAPTLLDAEAAVHDLMAALQAAEIEGPYLLVGHSMGGLLVRVFARLFPDQTAGLVLVDPVTVARHELLPYGMSDFALGLSRTLARLGVIRLSGLATQEAAGLPEPHFSQAVAILPTYAHFRGLAQEARLGESSMDFLRRGEQLTDLPLLVIEANRPGEGFDAAQRAVLHELYARLAAQSTQDTLRTVDGAGHATIVTQAEHAQAVTAAVLDLLTWPGSVDIVAR